MAPTDAHELINRAREYPLNHPARLALLAESTAVSLAVLAERADAPPTLTPTPSEPDPVLVELAASPSEETALSDAPTPPKRPRRARQTTSPAPTETNAA